MHILLAAISAIGGIMFAAFWLMRALDTGREAYGDARGLYRRTLWGRKA